MKCWSKTFLVSSVVLTTVGWGVVAQADNRDVVRRIVEFSGGMRRSEAKRLADTVSAKLLANVRAGGNLYDGIRQPIGESMFDGPGRTMPEYEERHRQVMARLGEGLTEPNLEALFAPKPGASLRCAANFGLALGACDALVAAASRQALTERPKPPTDGKELRRAMQSRGIDRRTARDIVTALVAFSIALPAKLQEAQGRGEVVDLVKACPGGSEDQTTLARTWQMGLDETLARCAVRHLGGGTSATPDAAAAKVQTVMGMDAPLSAEYARWALTN